MCICVTEDAARGDRSPHPSTQVEDLRAGLGAVEANAEQPVSQAVDLRLGEGPSHPLTVFPAGKLEVPFGRGVPRNPRTFTQCRGQFAPPAMISDANAPSEIAR